MKAITNALKKTKLAVLLLLLFPFPALAQQDSGKAPERGKVLLVRNADGSREVRNTPSDDPSYLIGPEDVLNISVWKEPDITRTVLVRPDGKISLPLLSDVQAAGLTPGQLAGSVTTGLRKYLADPQVTVVVTQINSQRIYILGEVNRPGGYPLFPGTTFLQALSSAGGFTQFADLKKIYLLRTENGRQMKFLFNYKNVVHGRALHENIVLKTGDTIVVP
jgi:polysaccharide biosynthesis/export protein